jgi:CHASE2 domain-containing sensor protein
MRWKLWSSSRGTRKNLEIEGISLFERVLKAAPAVVVAVILTFILSRSGFFRQLETYALDTQVRLQSAQQESDVAIVRIDDDDYETLFHAKSPLDPAALTKIINAIALGKPRVLGIDIDTSTQDFRDFHLQPGWPPIIWARNGSFSNREGKFHAQRVLGGQDPPPASGLVVLKLDADSAVRRYARLCATEHGQVPAFPFAVAQSYQGQAAKRNAGEDELFINFAGDREGSHRQHFTAAQVLSLSDGLGWQTDSPIKDKIVLLGGAYTSSDEHETPLGWMLGVEILAYTIETELHGGGMRPASGITITVLGGIIGLVLLLLFQHFTPTKALLLSFPVILLLGMVCSLLTFRTIAFWAYFTPIPLAVLVQEGYVQARDYRKRLVKQLYEGVLGRPAPEPGGVEVKPAAVVKSSSQEQAETASKAISDIG